MKIHSLGKVWLSSGLAIFVWMSPIGAIAENAANYDELAKTLAQPQEKGCGERLPDGTCPDVTEKTAQVMMQPKPVRQNIQMTFALGSAQLTPDATSKLDDFAKALQKVGSYRAFDVEGHTDRSGSETLNVALSQARAQAVVSYLAAKGVSPAKMRAKGYGFDRPLVGVDATDPANRRVEVSAP